jgi:hypothetical protein
MGHVVCALLHTVLGAPRHDRHGRGRVLRRPFDQLVRIDHIDEHVPLGVAAAHDLHLLEEQRTTLAKHVVALREFRLEADGTDLTACERDVRHFLGKTEPTLEAALFRHREVARHAVDLRVVEAIGSKLVVRRQPFEHRGAAEDQIRLIGGLCGGGAGDR